MSMHLQMCGTRVADTYLRLRTIGRCHMTWSRASRSIEPSVGRRTTTDARSRRTACRAPRPSTTEYSATTMLTHWTIPTTPTPRCRHRRTRYSRSGASVRGTSTVSCRYILRRASSTSLWPRVSSMSIETRSVRLDLTWGHSCCSNTNNCRTVCGARRRWPTWARSPSQASAVTGTWARRVSRNGRKTRRSRWRIPSGTSSSRRGKDGPVDGWLRGGGLRCIM